MDTTVFETALTVDGSTGIETVRLEPRPANGLHGHHFAVRGLVLDGAFTVTHGDTPVTYEPGQVFAVAQGDLHCEAVGAAGARILVGRKF